MPAKIANENIIMMIVFWPHCQGISMDTLFVRQRQILGGGVTNSPCAPAADHFPRRQFYRHHYHSKWSTAPAPYQCQRNMQLQTATLLQLKGDWTNTAGRSDERNPQLGPRLRIGHEPDIALAHFPIEWLSSTGFSPKRIKAAACKAMKVKGFSDPLELASSRPG